MISTLELQNFRGFEGIRFEKLGLANLIIGGNNVGKTSVLEALVVASGSSEQLSELPQTFRPEPSMTNHSQSLDYWTLLAKNPSSEIWVSTNDTVTTTATINNGTPNITRTNTRLSVRNYNSHLSGHLVLRQAIGTVKDVGPLSIIGPGQADPVHVSKLYAQVGPLDPDNELRIEELLRKSIDPRVRRLRYAKSPDSSVELIHVDLNEGRMLPFNLMGQAFVRTIHTYCEIFGTRPKILLIDEIENGLYYEGLEDYWRGLLEVLEDQQVQLFATTHSRECMEAAHRAAKARTEYPLRFLRLDRRVDDPAKIVATTFAGEEMQTAIDSNLEMR